MNREINALVFTDAFPEFQSGFNRVEEFFSRYIFITREYVHKNVCGNLYLAGENKFFRNEYC